MAEIIGFNGGVDPRVMGLGPTPAILNALEYADHRSKNMELVKLNEGLAAQSLGVIRELEEATGMDREAFLAKTNVNGGAITLGHPVGAGRSCWLPAAEWQSATARSVWRRCASVAVRAMPIILGAT